MIFTCNCFPQQVPLKEVLWELRDVFQICHLQTPNVSLKLPLLQLPYKFRQ